MTEPEDPDASFTRRFENLRAHEANDAPAFDATWAAAEERVRDRRRRIAAIAGFSTLVAAAAALLVVMGPRPSDRAHEPAPEPAMSIAPRGPSTAGESQTDFLLAAPTEPAVDLALGVDPFRYQLDRLIETGAAHD